MPESGYREIRVIDTHTAGEPTRVVLTGGPDLGGESLAGMRATFRERFDHLRTAIIAEPRGYDHLVGALLCPPQNPACTAGVIFFNNVGFLGMCGHGLMGVAVALAEMGRLKTGAHHFETPAGRVAVQYEGGSRVSIQNVPSYRHARGVHVRLADGSSVSGDVAWGGNWFFLAEEHGQVIEPGRVEELTRFTLAVRRALAEQGVTGAGGAEIDHIELAGPPSSGAADSRNFVLCPGGAFDRSPCGTGTSAKLACLAAEGQLAPGETWRQEGILGSIFEGSYERPESGGDPAGAVLPTISGEAFVTAKARLIFDHRDPFRAGIPL